MPPADEPLKLRFAIVVRVGTTMSGSSHRRDRPAFRRRQFGRHGRRIRLCGRHCPRRRVGVNQVVRRSPSYSSRFSPAWRVAISSLSLVVIALARRRERRLVAGRPARSCRAHRRGVFAALPGFKRLRWLASGAQPEDRRSRMSRSRRPPGMRVALAIDRLRALERAARSGALLRATSTLPPPSARISRIRSRGEGKSPSASRRRRPEARSPPAAASAP